MIYLDIYDFKIFIESSNPIIDARLKLEFDYFVSDQTLKHDLKISFELNSDLNTRREIPPNLTPTFQRSNSITYDEKGIRWNDYYGNVLSKFDLKNKYAHFVGKEIDKLYEVIFLFILSRSGKNLDLSGIHKIHAFSFAHNNKAIVCMQPMRGGKSTLLCEILKQLDVSIISDDTPLINLSGELFPFPLRMSLEALPTDLNLNEKDYFILKREFFKPKYSISLKAFKRPIAPAMKDYILIEARRSTFEDPLIKKNSALTTFRYLFKHMVVGIGLPIIFEYFWESGFNDFIIKTRIFISRFYLACKISISKECYTLYLSNNVQKNVNLISELLKNDNS